MEILRSYIIKISLRELHVLPMWSPNLYDLFYTTFETNELSTSVFSKDSDQGIGLPHNFNRIN